MKYVGIAAAVAAGFLSLASPSWAQGEYAGKTLRVATWGGDWREMRDRLIGEEIRKRTGATVQYVLGNPADNYAKLIAGTARGELPFDVIEMEDRMPPEMAGGGFLAPLDKNRIPNLRLVPDRLQKNDSVAFLSIQYGIAYNTEKFAELGLPKPTKWSDLANPKLAGRVAIPELSVSMGPYYIVGLARESGGSEADVSKAWDAIKKLDVLYYFTSSADLSTRMTSGEVWAAVWTDSRAFRLKNKGLPIDFARVNVAGSEGMVGYNSIGIIKNTPNRELAEMYVNLALDADVQYAMGKWGVTGPTNSEAAKLFEKDEVLAKQVVWSEKDFGRMYQMDWEVVVPNIKGWLNTWNRVVTR